MSGVEDIQPVMEINTPFRIFIADMVEEWKGKGYTMQQSIDAAAQMVSDMWEKGEDIDPDDENDAAYIVKHIYDPAQY